MFLSSPTWSIAIFTARETVDTLVSCIGAALVASPDRKVVIDVLVNGNRALADGASSAIRQKLALTGHQSVRVWFIRFADKAHAWNEYIHHIWQPSELAYFVDGYAIVRPDALLRLSDGLHQNSGPLGASGVPTAGRGATVLRHTMIRDGGIHGNLHAIRGAVMSQLRQQQVRLPIGLYRTDSLIGAILNFQLDPSVNDWDPRRILIQPDATWDMKTSPWWLPKNLVVQLKRRARQAQGALENSAVREHLAVSKQAPAALPRTINELVNGWIDADPARAARIYASNPLAYYAARRFRKPRDWSDADHPSELLGEL